MKLCQRRALVVLIVGLSIVGAPIVLAQEFQSSTARIAAWNLAGFREIPNERVDQQVEALRILDNSGPRLLLVHT